MTSRTTFAPKAPNETRTYSFDFTGYLAAGETISTKSVTAAIYSGTDASPSALVSGSASSSGAVVSQAITGGTAGNIYTLTCAITTSAGQSLTKSGYLALVPEVA